MKDGRTAYPTWYTLVTSSWHELSRCKRVGHTTIDTTRQTTCKACGKPLEQASRRGPHLREYCDATCRQRGHRAKQQAPDTVTIVTIDEKQALEQRIAQLEREVETLKALRSRRSSIDAQVRHNWQERAMAWGEKLGYQRLTFEVSVKEGVKEWRAFVRDASDLVLIRLIMAAENVTPS